MKAKTKLPFIRAKGVLRRLFNIGSEEERIEKDIHQLQQEFIALVAEHIANGFDPQKSEREAAKLIRRTPLLQSTALRIGSQPSALAVFLKKRQRKANEVLRLRQEVVAANKVARRQQRERRCNLVLPSESEAVKLAADFLEGVKERMHETPDLTAAEAIKMMRIVYIRDNPEFFKERGSKGIFDRAVCEVKRIDDEWYGMCRASIGRGVARAKSRKNHPLTPVPKRDVGDAFYVVEDFHKNLHKRYAIHPNGSESLEYIPH